MEINEVLIILLLLTYHRYLDLSTPRLWVVPLRYNTAKYDPLMTSGLKSRLDSSVEIAYAPVHGGEVTWGYTSECAPETPIWPRSALLLVTR